MAQQRIFLAGATGAVGRRLSILLKQAGHTVFGTTRSVARSTELTALGIEPVIVDVFDAVALRRAVSAAQPDSIIHQLTDLPRDLDPKQMPEAIVRNARIRGEGTRNLVAAALAAGAHRLIAQSIAWAYAPGPEPHSEESPLDAQAQGDRGISVRGVIELEGAVLGSPRLQGMVLRYGQLYGPGTHADRPSQSIPVHVDAAACAALLAIERGKAGAFNIAEPNAHVTTGKATAELGWSADFRIAQDSSSSRNGPRNF